MAQFAAWRVGIVWWLVWAAAGAIWWGGEPAAGQTSNSYPMLMSLRPAAAVVGATTEHELSSRYNLAGASAVVVSGSGVWCTVAPAESEKPEDKDRNDVSASKAKLTFTCAADAVPGIRDFRVITPHGASTVGQCVVVREPVAVELPDNASPGNDTAATAQPVTSPATLCGAIEKGEDADFWKVRFESPGPAVFHMVSQRLLNRLHDMQSRVDPMLTLRRGDGVTLATADNTFAGDPLLRVMIPEAGDYLLEVRDVRYQGNVDWTYAIEVGARPLVRSVHPLAVPAGGVADVELIAGGLAAEARAALRAPAQAAGRVVRLAPVLDGVALGGVDVYATSDPIIGEQAPSASQCAVPCVLVGRIDAPGEADRFTLSAHKGEAFSFEVLARRIGSDLDARLRILHPDQKSLSEADDATYQRVLSADPFLDNWTAPVDGDYTVEISDIHSRGGSGFPYCVKVVRATPTFLIEADTDKTLLAPGMAAPIYVRALRRSGFSGDIQLAIEGLPPGVTAVPGRILATGVDGCIWLEAAADAQPSWSNVTISGSSAVRLPDGTTVPIVISAVNLQEIYMPGGGRGHYPVDLHTVSVSKPMDVRGITVSSTAVNLRPGESQRLDITVERAPDYKGNITLDCMLQHLETPYGNPLPKGVTVDVAASKTLLTAGESSGHITLKAAADCPPVDRQLVPVTVHASINFVMKHTFASAPVEVSVAAP
ncbi:MAG: hypothetical protein DWH79_06220 [Planctomycetota bacterium]|nr:MAG: hypothetical protein DWH79_06220 [Planctomycetota bacterium]